MLGCSENSPSTSDEEFLDFDPDGIGSINNSTDDEILGMGNPIIKRKTYSAEYGICGGVADYGTGCMFKTGTYSNTHYYSNGF